MVGIPSQQKKLEQLGEELGVQTWLYFMERSSEEHLVKALKGSDLFLMLSEAQSDGDVEGFGIAVLEANACGVPAIGSKGCGIEDAIEDHYSGRLGQSQRPGGL